MGALTVSVMDFSRGLSTYLDRVQHDNLVLDITRGKCIVARVSPVTPSEGYPIAQLDALLATGPQLSAAERAAMARDIRSDRARLRARTTP